MAPPGPAALRVSFPVSSAQRFQVPDASPEKRAVPSGEKRKTVSGARWPFALSRGAPVLASSRTTVEGLLSPASPGRKATATASSVWPEKAAALACTPFNSQRTLPEGSSTRRSRAGTAASGHPSRPSPATVASRTAEPSCGEGRHLGRLALAAFAAGALGGGEPLHRAEPSALRVEGAHRAVRARR